MKIIIILFLIGFIPIQGGNAVDMSDFEACMYHLEILPSTLNLKFGFKELVNICDEIVNEGFIYIEREGQRNIMIILSHLNSQEEVIF